MGLLQKQHTDSGLDVYKRQGYVLPEGWHYVLDENGFVILLEDGSPKIEADQAQQQGETPEAYEARTGYVLPEGWHYMLDENGFVILMEDGSPAIEQDSCLLYTSIPALQIFW